MVSDADSPSLYDFFRVSRMLNYERCCDWLNDQVGKIQMRGVVLRATENRLPPKRGIAVEAVRGESVAGLYIWETGEADIEVLVDGKFVLSKWGIILCDSTLSQLFDHFLSEVRHHFGVE